MSTDAKILSAYLGATDEQKSASQTLKQMDAVREKMLDAGPGATAVALAQFAETMAEVARRDRATREKVERDVPEVRPKQVDREAPRPHAGETTGALVVAADVAATRPDTRHSDALAEEVQMRLAEVAAGQRPASEFTRGPSAADQARGLLVAERSERVQGKERE